MSEREPIRIPIKVIKSETDALAPESTPALPSGEIAVFDAKQASRLSTFRNILRRVQTEEQYLKEKGTPNRFGSLDSSGKMTEPYMRMDSRFINRWNHVAENMYATELSQDPATKQAALDITEQIRAEFDGPKAMSAKEVRDLFNR